MPERRAYERYTLVRLATITAPGAARPEVCVVRDVSRQGALIEAAAVESVPPVFRLSVAGVRAARFCRVVRRTLDRLAVTFIDAPAATVPSTLGPAAGAMLAPGRRGGPAREPRPA